MIDKLSPPEPPKRSRSNRKIANTYSRVNTVQYAIPQGPQHRWALNTIAQLRSLEAPRSACGALLAQAPRASDVRTQSTARRLALARPRRTAQHRDRQRARAARLRALRHRPRRPMRRGCPRLYWDASCAARRPCVCAGPVSRPSSWARLRLRLRLL